MIITYTIFLTYLLYNISFMMLSLWGIYFSSRDMDTVKLVFKDHSMESPSLVSKHRWSLNTSQACLQRPLNGEFKHGLLT